MLPLPGEPLPDHKLLQYLGPTLTDTAKGLPAGGHSEPVRVGDKWVILQVPYKQPLEPRPFDTVKDRVAMEYERRRGDEALAAYLDDLRDQTEVAVDEAFLDSIAPEPN